MVRGTYTGTVAHAIQRPLVGDHACKSDQVQINYAKREPVSNTLHSAMTSPAQYLDVEGDGNAPVRGVGGNVGEASGD